jgi:hypothetical protein
VNCFRISSCQDLPQIPRPRRQNSRLKAISDGVSLMRADIVQNQTPRLGKMLLNIHAVPIEPEGSAKEASSEFDDKKVIFSEENDMLLTDTSINSVDSVNGDSDIDDVPDIVPSERSSPVRNMRMLHNSHIAAFLQGHNYRQSSLILGPMACGFLIAM